MFISVQVRGLTKIKKFVRLSLKGGEKMKEKKKKISTFYKENKRIDALQKKFERINEQLDEIQEEGTRLIKKDAEGAKVLQMKLQRICNQLNATKKEYEKLERDKANDVEKFKDKLVEISWRQSNDKGRFKCIFTKVLFVDRGWFYFISSKINHIKEGLLPIAEITKIVEL